MGNSDFIGLMPRNNGLRQLYIDATYNSRGKKFQHLTIKAVIMDSCGKQLVHVLSCYMKGKSEEAYQHVFECVFYVFKKYHDYKITDIVSMTDCEVAISSGLSLAAEKMGIRCLNFYCQVHVCRLAINGMEKLLGRRNAARYSTVRLACLFIQMTVSFIYLV